MYLVSSVYYLPHCRGEAKPLPEDPECQGDPDLSGTCSTNEDCPKTGGNVFIQYSGVTYLTLQQERKKASKKERKKERNKERENTRKKETNET